MKCILSSFMPTGGGVCVLVVGLVGWAGFPAQAISTFPPVHMAVIISADNTGLRGSPSQGPAPSPALYHATDDATDGGYALSCPSPVVTTNSRALTLKKGIVHQSVPFKVVWVSSPPTPSAGHCRDWL